MAEMLALTDSKLKGVGVFQMMHTAGQTVTTLKTICWTMMKKILDSKYLKTFPIIPIKI